MKFLPNPASRRYSKWGLWIELVEHASESSSGYSNLREIRPNHAKSGHFRAFPDIF